MNFTPDAKEVRYTMVGILLGLFLAALDQTIVSTAMPRIVGSSRGPSTTPGSPRATSSPPRSRPPSSAASRSSSPGRPSWWRRSSSSSSGPPSRGFPRTWWSSSSSGGAGPGRRGAFRPRPHHPRRPLPAPGAGAARRGLRRHVRPLLGGGAVAWGLLTDHFSWRWVFYVNMPVGAVALWFILRHMPRLSPGKRGAL